MPLSSDEIMLYDGPCVGDTVCTVSPTYPSALVAPARARARAYRKRAWHAAALSRVRAHALTRRRRPVESHGRERKRPCTGPVPCTARCRARPGARPGAMRGPVPCTARCAAGAMRGPVPCAARCRARPGAVRGPVPCAARCRAARCAWHVAQEVATHRWSLSGTALYRVPRSISPFPGTGTRERVRGNG